MDFNYNPASPGTALDAYEKALLDCLLGDPMLFWRQDGVELSWAFLNPVIAECEQCTERARRLHFYPAGSPGPEAIRRWPVAAEGRGGPSAGLRGAR
jgi:glucose-6-phosphate 1-dehydrogenase